MSLRHAQTFPFSAIVGQDTLKSALLLNAVDPRVGGVLIRGEKGTAKSTAVRALAALLPPIDVVDGCRYACDPGDPRSWCEDCRQRSRKEPLPRSAARPRFVDLPVSATEDRLVGTLDLEHALKHGERRFEPGLLAEANRGILYVDEVNLLDDHLVDTLLDAAAMGVNVVEREGIAFSHPARFILVGTMNPEEGDVRPQLLDRFGLCVDVTGLSEPLDRVAVVRRRGAYESDPEAFAREWEVDEDGIRGRIATARPVARASEPDDRVMLVVATICAEMGVDGHRADLTMTRAACALAALEGRDTATIEDVTRVAPLVLAHRLRRTPFEDQVFDERRLQAAVAKASTGPDGSDSGAPQPDPEGEGSGETALLTLHTSGRAASVAEEAICEQPRLVVGLDHTRRSQAGRRQQTAAGDHRGRYTRSEALRDGDTPDVAFDATLRAAAPHQASREGDMAIKVEREDVRNKVRKRRVGASIVFCVDASGSMGASARMDVTKAAVLDLLVDAYQRRDRVGVVSFRGDAAEVLLGPTSSVELAQVKLRSMPVGGATPLAHGILRSLELLAAERRRDQQVVPWLVVVTDGRANVALSDGLGSDDARNAAVRVKESRVNALVIDTDAGIASLGAAREIARVAGAEYMRLARFDGGVMATAVRERLEAV
ncbi:MAG: magnesium chelatase subunit D family protein [Coriobacteriia bacterium]